MNQQLSSILRKVFTLSDHEFDPQLTREQVSAWDSLRHMDLVATIEEEYGVLFDMDEILEMQSFENIEAALRSKGVDV